MKLAAICLGACALLPLPALAAPVTLSFSAVVSQSSDGQPGVGSIITGSFVFDRDPATHLALPGADPNQSTSYLYGTDSSDIQLQYPVGYSSPDFSPVGIGIEVADGLYGVDLVSFGSKLNAISYLLSFEAGLDSFAGSALPTSEWLTSGWSGAFFNVRDSNFNRLLAANVTSVSVTPVPEPTTTALSLLGLGTVWGAKRRKGATRA